MENDLVNSQLIPSGMELSTDDKETSFYLVQAQKARFKEIMEDQILKVDLSNKSYQIESLPDKILRKYLGGMGLGAYYLYRDVLLNYVFHYI